MNRQAPPAGEAATWKGLVIIGGAVVVGLAVFASFGTPTTATGGSPPDTEASRTKVTVPPVTVPEATTTSMPLRDPKDVKIVVANGTSTSGGSKKIIDALKPACFAVQLPVDATAKVKAEKRPTTTVYSTPGYEREAAQITTRLGLQTTANAALPPDLPIPKGAPAYNVLVLVGQDLLDSPPQPLPPCEGATTASTSAGGSTSSTRRSGTTTTRARTSTTKVTTSTTKASTTSTT